ncbi:hypothetical protein LJE71_17415 [Xanthobacter autotrophicus]|uniref:hypothetical protein n=1 Tax=Xanthobacter autotrophicus TaxID=280 RepID=UPI001E5B71DF|nr:hypothetical protein [Xanthobacter autotrophicus]UDQ88046.1 hypothetical protein LJE71_17415 [Xanthobacter autotrophicus]
MSLTARLLLLVALLCGALGLAGATSGAVFANVGCHHEAAQGTPAKAGPDEVTAAVAASLVASVSSEQHAPLHRAARPIATTHLGHAGGASVPSGASCCFGTGCLMACHWVALELVPAVAPLGVGVRLGFATAADRPAGGPEVQLPPPRYRA